MANPPWLDKGVFCVLVLLTLVDGGLTLYVKSGNNYIPQDIGAFYREGVSHDTNSPPEGFSSDGRRIVTTGKVTAGWAVRYAAPGCEYCRADEAMWRHMADELNREGYRLIVVVPRAKDAYPEGSLKPSGGLQLSFVNMDWIKQFSLGMTPTLLIFDSRRGLIWSHQGTLSPGDPAAAVREINSAKKN